VRLHVKGASTRESSDGVFELWINGTLLHALYDAPFHNFDPTVPDAVMRHGYFMGWSNSGFDEQTVFHIDDVKFFASRPNW
jgi:hypothetical protein